MHQRKKFRLCGQKAPIVIPIFHLIEFFYFPFSAFQFCSHKCLAQILNYLNQLQQDCCIFYLLYFNNLTLLYLLYQYLIRLTYFAPYIEPRYSFAVSFSNFNQTFKITFVVGTSHGLVVMGENSCLRGHGFGSRHCILDGHVIFHIDLLIKIVLFV